MHSNTNRALIDLEFKGSRLSQYANLEYFCKKCLSNFHSFGCVTAIFSLLLLTRPSDHFFFVIFRRIFTFPIKRSRTTPMYQINFQRKISLLTKRNFHSSNSSRDHKTDRQLWDVWILDLFYFEPIPKSDVSNYCLMCPWIVRLFKKVVLIVFFDQLKSNQSGRFQFWTVFSIRLLKMQLPK